MRSRDVLLFLGMLLHGYAAHAEDEKRPAVDTEHLFGFTEGSDIGEKGGREFETAIDGRIGRPGRFSVFTSETNVNYGVTDNFRLAFGTFADYSRTRSVSGVDDHTGVRWSGLSGEARLRLLDRNTHAAGVTLSFSPSWRRIDDTTIQHVVSYTLPVALLADAEIVPERLYAAVNASWEPSFTKEDGRWRRERPMEFSGALAAAISPGLFIGGEIRQLTRNFFSGGALFVGPSVSLRLSEKSVVKAAWSTQIPREFSGRRDLVNFERHQLRAQFSVEF